MSVCIAFDFAIWWKVGDMPMFDEDVTNDPDSINVNEYGDNNALHKGRQFSRRTSDVVLMERRGSLNI